MDYGFKFEQLLNKYLGRPTYITYAENWSDKNDRTALLFTACIKEYDTNSSGEIGEKLQYYMEQLFNDKDDKKISIECLHFLCNLN